MKLRNKKEKEKIKELVSLSEQKPRKRAASAEESSFTINMSEGMPDNTLD